MQNRNKEQKQQSVTKPRVCEIFKLRFSFLAAATAFTTVCAKMGRPPFLYANEEKGGRRRAVEFNFPKTASPFLTSCLPRVWSSVGIERGVGGGGWGWGDHLLVWIITTLFVKIWISPSSASMKLGFILMNRVSVETGAPERREMSRFSKVLSNRAKIPIFHLLSIATLLFSPAAGWEFSL